MAPAEKLTRKIKIFFNFSKEKDKAMTPVKETRLIKKTLLKE